MHGKPEPNRYEDILEHPRPISAKRARMPMIDRAAQFAPFAALSGYEAVIRETARLTEEYVELDESVKSILNEKLQLLMEQIDTAPVVTITFFQPDERKKGGAYVKITGAVKKIDPYAQAIMLQDETVIPVSSVYNIESPLFYTDTQ